MVDWNRDFQGCGGWDVMSRSPGPISGEVRSKQQQSHSSPHNAPLRSKVIMTGESFFKNKIIPSHQPPCQSLCHVPYTEEAQRDREVREWLAKAPVQHKWRIDNPSFLVIYGSPSQAGALESYTSISILACWSPHVRCISMINFLAVYICLL